SARRSGRGRERAGPRRDVHGLRAGRAHHDARAGRAGGVVTTTAGAYGRRRILIIEDGPDLVRGLRAALEVEGFEVFSAGQGREGVRLLRERGPDLVLLDLMLPDANGFAVCEEIRSTHPLVPVIMLTARSQETDKIRGLDAGADDYVTKP